MLPEHYQGNRKITLISVCAIQQINNLNTLSRQAWCPVIKDIIFRVFWSSTNHKKIPKLTRMASFRANLFMKKCILIIGTKVFLFLYKQPMVNWSFSCPSVAHITIPTRTPQGQVLTGLHRIVLLKSDKPYSLHHIKKILLNTSEHCTLPALSSCIQYLLGPDLRLPNCVQTSFPQYSETIGP